MRALFLLAVAGLAMALTGCPGSTPPLESKLARQTDLDSPPTAAAPGLTSDLLPPGLALSPQ